MVVTLSGDVVTVTVALVAPAGTVTLAGTVATAVLLLESVTSAPPDGAAAVNVTVPVEELPPTTDVGLTLTADRLAGAGTAGAACAVKRRVEENGPATPAALMPRTRHHNRCAGNPVMLVCDTLTNWFALNGAAMVEESSI